MAAAVRVKQQVVENKKSDMQEYMEKAAALIQQYVPPDPAQIQKAKDAGQMRCSRSRREVRVEFRNYVQPNDQMAIDVDAKAALLSGLSVATYLEKPEDAVTLNVRFGALADGTSYTAQTTWTSRPRASPLSSRTPGTVRSRGSRLY